MKDLTKFKINPLYIDVVDEIAEDSQEYGYATEQENIIARLNDISHGLSSGIVGRLIYYADTCQFFEKFKYEIGQLLDEFIDCTGCDLSQSFRDWDKSDPLALHTHNQNLLAWFAYEEIAIQLRNYLED